MGIFIGMCIGMCVSMCSVEMKQEMIAPAAVLYTTLFRFVSGVISVIALRLVTDTSLPSISLCKLFYSPSSHRAAACGRSCLCTCMRACVHRKIVGHIVSHMGNPSNRCHTHPYVLVHDVAHGMMLPTA